MTPFNQPSRFIKAGDITSLRHALDDGLSPNLANRFSWTLLMLAATTRDVKLAQLLISKGADLDKQNNFGETALSLAAQKGHEKFVKLLLSNGACADCAPHGHNLEDWMRMSSGLTERKLSLLLRLIKAPGAKRN
jgi:ankyrin repeat protein